MASPWARWVEVSEDGNVNLYMQRKNTNYNHAIGNDKINKGTINGSQQKKQGKALKPCHVKKQVSGSFSNTCTYQDRYETSCETIQVQNGYLIV